MNKEECMEKITRKFHICGFLNLEMSNVSGGTLYTKVSQSDLLNEAAEDTKGFHL